MHKQHSKERQRDIFIRAGRNARIEGQPLSSCPSLKRREGDTYGAWLEQQWRTGWLLQDDKLRQQTLSFGK